MNRSAKAPELTTPAQAGQAYATLGLRVIILHRPTATGRVPSCTCWQKSGCDCVGKHPRLNKWQEKATNDSEMVAQWFKDWRHSNVGIVTGEESGVVCLDIDPKHGGEETLAASVEKHGPLPITWEQSTGSGAAT